MKARQKKQQDNDVARLSSAAMQTKLLPDVRSHESPFSKPETAQSISQEEQGRDQGFNFAEIPIFADTSGAAPSPLQRKLNVSLAREKQEGQAAGLEAVTATQAGQQQPVQRNAEEEEEPMQGKLEPIQREEGEEEEPMQGKLEPIQREEGEEEEPMQGKLEPVQREEGEEEEPMQGKLEPVQREEGEEEEPMQGKLEPVQREEGEEEEPMQGKGESDQKVKAIQPKINLAPSGGGKSMPEPVQQKMEGAFGADFSGVRIHEGPQAKAINAIAYTQGSDIHFQPGKYQPDTRSGQELLGHELTHVVQQKAGKVTVTQRKGAPINAEPKLELEADILGAKAARGESVQIAGATTSLQNNLSIKQRLSEQLEPVQLYKEEDKNSSDSEAKVEDESDENSSDSEAQVEEKSDENSSDSKAKADQEEKSEEKPKDKFSQIDEQIDRYKDKKVQIKDQIFEAQEELENLKKSAKDSEPSSELKEQINDCEEKIAALDYIKGIENKKINRGRMNLAVRGIQDFLTPKEEAKEKEKEKEKEEKSSENKGFWGSIFGQAGSSITSIFNNTIKKAGVNAAKKIGVTSALGIKGLQVGWRKLKQWGRDKSAKYKRDEAGNISDGNGFTKRFFGMFDQTKSKDAKLKKHHEMADNILKRYKKGDKSLIESLGLSEKDLKEKDNSAIKKMILEKLRDRGEKTSDWFDGVKGWLLDD